MKHACTDGDHSEIDSREDDYSGAHPGDFHHREGDLTNEPRLSLHRVLFQVQDYAERRSLRGELRALQKEERQRQQRAVDEVMKKAAVVCATLSGALMRELRPLQFDVAVIDEAAQVHNRP